MGKMDSDELPYLVEIYKGRGAKQGDIESKLANCVVWALNSGNALRKVQQYYPPIQHSYIVSSVRKLGDKIADLSESNRESTNSE